MDVSLGGEQAAANQVRNETLSLPGLFVDVRVSRNMVEGDGIEREQPLVPLYDRLR